MPASDYSATTGPAVDLESESSLRVDCYVRSTVPPTVTEAIDDVVERLRRLRETGHIDDYQTTCWPPEPHAVDNLADDHTTTRDELVAEFERWAAQSGRSLEPAFRRLEIQQSPIGLGCDEPHERVRVPFVSLAIYEADDTDGETLRGVVPYTEQSQTTDGRTYTVDEWLSAVEPVGPDTHSQRSSNEQPTRLGSHQ